MADSAIEMKNIAIYAHDYSLSTLHNKKYFDEANVVLENFELKHKDDEKIYLLWGNTWQIVSKNELDYIYRTMKAEGYDTQPKNIPIYIKKMCDLSKVIDLTIITDGQIYKEAIAKCAAYNFGIKYKSIQAHSIGANLDISVFAPFAPNTKITLNIDGESKTFDTFTDFEYDTITLDNLNEKSEELTSYIKLKFVASNKDLFKAIDESTNDNTLKEKYKKDVLRVQQKVVQDLKDTERRLLKEARNLDKDIQKLDLTSKNGKVLIDILKKELSKTENLLIKKIHNVFSGLISYIQNDDKDLDLKKQIKFEARKENGIDEEENDKPEIYNLENVQECESIDLITLENIRIPSISLNKSDYLENIMKDNYQFFQTILMCPLFIKKVDLGAILEVDTFIKLWENGKIGPYREEMIGSIIPHKQYDEYNDISISHAMLFGKRAPKQFYSLIYFVIFKIMEQNDRFKELLPQMEKYALYRIETGTGYLELRNTPLDSNKIVPLGVACYYCVELSSLMYADDKDKYTKEGLRAYFNISEYLIEIVKKLGYDLNEDFIKKRAFICKYGNILSKMDHKNALLYVCDYFFERTENGFLTSKLKKNVNFDMITAFLRKRDMVPLNYKNINLETLNKYLILSYHFVEKEEILLCEKTFRPFYIIDGDTYVVKLIDCLYEVLIEKNEIVIKKFTGNLDYSKLLSLKKMYINYVIGKNKYPTLEEFRKHILDEKNMYGDCVRLFPENVEKDINSTWMSYQQFKNVNMVDFISTGIKTIPIEERKILEKS